MLLGTALLTATLIALAVALGFSLLDLRRPESRHRDRAVKATWAATGFGGGAFVLLGALFLMGDTSVGYVWRNIDTTYPWYQRLSGLWVGREGSLLLWALATLSFWSLEERRHTKAVGQGIAHATAAHASLHHRNGAGATRDDVESIRRIARTALLALVLILFGVVALEHVFRATASADLALAPHGRGVNPQLVTLYNSIHPPIVFMGYALSTLPFAFALGHLVTGRPGWVGAARRWAHPAFLFLTTGVFLGALWAYIALGWGGYWAWDPVEVGSLIPWVFVTAFLHAAMRHDQKDEMAVFAPALGFLLLPAALFSTFIVRAGGLWRSVHNFLGEGRSVTSWERLMNALSGENEVRVYAGLLALLLVAFVPLLMRHVDRIEKRLGSAAPAPAKEPPERLGDRLLSHLTLRTLFTIGTLLLALLGTVLVAILVMSVDGFASDAARTEAFESRTGPIALTAATVMAAAVAYGAIPKRRLVELVGLAFVVGLIAGWLVFPDHLALALAGSVLVLAAVLTLFRITTAWRDARPREAGRRSAVHLVHLGVILVLLGHGVVSTFATGSEVVQLKVGDSQDVADYTVRLDSVTGADRDDNGRLDHIVATLTVFEDGERLGTTTMGFILYANQQHYKPEVGILRGLGKDVYLAPRGIHDPAQDLWVYANLPFDQQEGVETVQVDGVTFGVSTLPYINILWAGAGAMVLGAALLTLHTWVTPRPAGVRSALPETPGPAET
ncbi:MAG: cytochrome c biogenesis protein CcsA [Euryarchaeota archaeon]|nr:cytochrome c biogenesis protein CcsA [Euryarchaeota archaeon]